MKNKITQTKHKLSPSKLSLFKDCKRYFWLQENLRIRRPSSIFPSLPGGVDRVLKTYFDTFRFEDELPPEINELSDCKLFTKKEVLDRWRNNWQGIRWTNPEGHLFRGAVDEILVKNKELVVLDYKTRGALPKDETVGYYQHQLDSYAFLLDKEGFDVSDTAYLLFYSPKEAFEGGCIDFNTTLVSVKVDPVRALILFNNAIECLNDSIPSEGCAFCNHHKGVAK